VTGKLHGLRTEEVTGEAGAAGKRSKPTNVADDGATCCGKQRGVTCTRRAGLVYG
jgi:hypothetical protein